MTEPTPEDEDYAGVIRATTLGLAVIISIGISIYAATTPEFDVHLPIVSWLCTLIAYFYLPRAKD